VSSDVWLTACSRNVERLDHRLRHAGRVVERHAMAGICDRDDVDAVARETLSIWIRQSSRPEQICTWDAEFLERFPHRGACPHCQANSTAVEAMRRADPKGSDGGGEAGGRQSFEECRVSQRLKFILRL
jgi:hypothetical protein